MGTWLRLHSVDAPVHGPTGTDGLRARTDTETNMGRVRKWGRRRQRQMIRRRWNSVLLVMIIVTMSVLVFLLLLEVLSMRWLCVRKVHGVVIAQTYRIRRCDLLLSMNIIILSCSRPCYLYWFFVSFCYSLCIHHFSDSYSRLFIALFLVLPRRPSWFWTQYLAPCVCATTGALFPVATVHTTPRVVRDQ